MQALHKLNNWLYTNSAIIFRTLVFLLIAVVVLKSIGYLYNRREGEDYSVERQKYLDSVQYYRNKAGDIVAHGYEKQKYETSKEDRKTIDSLRKQLSLSKREINSYLRIINSTDYTPASTGKTDTIILRGKDSLPIYKYSYNDGRLKYKASAYPDSLKFTLFQTTDSIYALYSNKKIGKKTFREIHIVSSNPSTITTGIKTISYETPKQYSPISLGVHAGIDIISRQPVISIGINYDILRIKKKIK